MSDLINKEDALYATEVGRDNWTSPNNSEAWWACGEMRDAIRKAIESLPTIDAVEVVRCKECKHYQGVHNCKGHAPCGYWEQMTMWDDFCSRGERNG